MAPKDVDTTVDHTGTVHDYWMGGKDHSTVSWEAAEEVLRARPAPTLAPAPAADGRDERSWPANVWLVKRGIKVPM
jgi:hypothetical protein